MLKWKSAKQTVSPAKNRGGPIRRILQLLVAACCLGACLALWIPAQPAPNPDAPRFTAKNEMLRPDNYREWVWLSSGLGMSYRPEAAGKDQENPAFDNVFVSPAAYHTFRETGTWPDNTVLVLELRASLSHASINQSGHFQSGLIAIEAHVKDSHRFPGNWAFFGFGRNAQTAAAFPMSADCYSCHARSAAVDTTFVQFYPTLFEIAKQKHTLQPGYQDSPSIHPPH